MSLIKRKTRKKLSKQLTKIVKKHGPEAALALVTGIVTKLTDERRARAGARARTKLELSPEAKARRAVIVGSRRGQDAQTSQAS